MDRPHDDSVSSLREEYAGRPLLEDQTDPDPIRQFGRWFAEALDARLPDPNAMALATATPDGVPSVRMVLLKGFDGDGFVLYTNYDSRKGEELRANPHAALCFFWHALARQVRIEGDVEMVSPAESDVYFESRPLGSRIGAWASDQSRVAKDRGEIEERQWQMEDRFGSGPVPRPIRWGGYRVRPYAIEFWQGRPNRLHDRLRYRLCDGVWIRERLFP